jgi:arsenite methyltransferase
MALSCPVTLDPQRLREEVRAIHGRVAESPEADFHFHRGPRYAVELLGYDAAELAGVPARASASFAGVGNPHAIDALAPGEIVVDIGCGAGMDLLLAARRVGPAGRAIGVDMTASMIDAARAAAREAGLGHVDVREGDTEALPVDDASVDVVISNGVLNLTSDKGRAFAEIARILRPGGRLLLADIAVENELSEQIRSDIDLWTS